MENNTNWYLVILALLIGGLFVYAAFPRTEIVTKTTPGEIVYQDRIVNVSVPTDPLANAKSDFWDEFSSDSDYWTCGHDSYDLKDITISQIKNSYDVETSSNGKKQTINFDARLRFDDANERACYDTLAVKVVYEKGELPLVTIN